MSFFCTSSCYPNLHGQLVNKKRTRRKMKAGTQRDSARRGSYESLCPRFQKTSGLDRVRDALGYTIMGALQWCAKQVVFSSKLIEEDARGFDDPSRRDQLHTPTQCHVTGMSPHVSCSFVKKSLVSCNRIGVPPAQLSRSEILVGGQRGHSFRRCARPGCEVMPQEIRPTGEKNGFTEEDRC
jgi:hypothetical protein